MSENTNKAAWLWVGGIVLFCLVFVSVLAPYFTFHIERSRQMRCKKNLSQIGKSMVLYKQDYGRHKRFPEADGSQYICSIYFMNILLEKDIYLCPSTKDKNTDYELRRVGDLQKPIDDYLVANEGGPTSYAGRKNRNSREYPGIFRRYYDGNGITPMGSDDWHGPEGEGNHETGKLVNFLFADAHVDDLRISEVEPSEDHGYSFFQKAYFPDVNNPNLADPLTN